jgi:hypothetical protein
MNVFLLRLFVGFNSSLDERLNAAFRALTGLNPVLDSIDVLDPESLEASEVFDPENLEASDEAIDVDDPENLEAIENGIEKIDLV